MRRWLSRSGMRALLAMLRGFARLPYPVVRSAGNGLGTVLYWLVGPRRRIAPT